MHRPRRWPIASAQLGAFVAREDGWVCFARSLPDMSRALLKPGNPPPGAHTTGALGHASMLAAPASGRVAVLAPRRQARRVVARRVAVSRRVAVARARDRAGDDDFRDDSRGDDRPVEAAECFSCYVTKPGGLYRAKQQGDLAQTLHMHCDIGGSVELGIGNAANLHLGAALSNAWLPSVCPVSKPKGRPGPEIAGIYYLDDIITESFEFKDGRVFRPQGAGLSITVDEDKIREYSV